MHEMDRTLESHERMVGAIGIAGAAVGPQQTT